LLFSANRLLSGHGCIIKVVHVLHLRESLPGKPTAMMKTQAESACSKRHPPRNELVEGRGPFRFDARKVANREASRPSCEHLCTNAAERSTQIGCAKKAVHEHRPRVSLTVCDWEALREPGRDSVARGLRREVPARRQPHADGPTAQWDEGTTHRFCCSLLKP